MTSCQSVSWAPGEASSHHLGSLGRPTWASFPRGLLLFKFAVAPTGSLDLCVQFWEEELRRPLCHPVPPLRALTAFALLSLPLWGGTSGLSVWERFPES